MPRQRRHQQESNNTPPSTIGERIRLAREQLGLTQEQLATQIRMSRVNFNRIEQGHWKHINIEVLGKIAKATEQPLGFFLMTTDSEETRSQDLSDMPDALRFLLENVTYVPREHHEPLIRLLISVVTWYRKEFIST